MDSSSVERALSVQRPCVQCFTATKRILGLQKVAEIRLVQTRRVRVQVSGWKESGRRDVSLLVGSRSLETVGRCMLCLFFVGVVSLVVSVQAGWQSSGEKWSVHFWTSAQPASEAVKTVDAVSYPVHVFVTATKSFQGADRERTDVLFYLEGSSERCIMLEASTEGDSRTLVVQVDRSKGLLILIWNRYILMLGSNDGGWKQLSNFKPIVSVYGSVHKAGNLNGGQHFGEKGALDVRLSVTVCEE